MERFVARPVCAADATGIDIAGPVTLDADLIVPTAAHGMVLIARQRQQSLQPPKRRGASVLREVRLGTLLLTCRGY